MILNTDSSPIIQEKYHDISIYNNIRDLEITGHSFAPLPHLSLVAGGQRDKHEVSCNQNDSEREHVQNHDTTLQTPSAARNKQPIVSLIWGIMLIGEISIKGCLFTYFWFGAKDTGWRWYLCVWLQRPINLYGFVYDGGILFSSDKRSSLEGQSYFSVCIITHSDRCFVGVRER